MIGNHFRKNEDQVTLFLMIKKFIFPKKKSSSQSNTEITEVDIATAINKQFKTKNKKQETEKSILSDHYIFQQMYSMGKE